MTIKFKLSLPLVAAVGLALFSAPLFAQDSEPPAVAALEALPNAPSATLAQDQSSSPPNAQPGDGQQKEPGPDAKLPQTSRIEQNSSQTPVSKQQTKRILWVLPNYTAVSADANVPPLDAKGKFKLFLNDSFDYSTFIYVGALAGIGLASDNVPQFHQGAAGYGRYYWHYFADQALGNSLTEFMLPVAFKSDPRYFTKGHGSFFSRAGYGVSRLAVTRTDSGNAAPNFSEIVGDGAAAAIGSRYYPSQQQTWTKIGQRWVEQIALDGLFDVVKEFWPDVSHSLFHRD